MRWYIIVLISVFMSTVIVFWYPSFVVNSYTVLGSSCMYPLAYAHASVIKPCNDLSNALDKYRDLLNKYRSVQSAYQELHSRYLILEAASSYAHDVEKELDWFKKRFDPLVAHVVPVMGVHRSDRQHSMLIEGGSNRGIERDMVVLTDNLLVGKVITVYPWYSIVQLITDPASCVSVYGVCSDVHGIVRGTGIHNKLLLERVDHLSPVQENELLLSSGDGLIIPRGYGIGLVESYKSDGLYYTGEVKVLHDSASLKTCLVVEHTNLLKIS